MRGALALPAGESSLLESDGDSGESPLPRHPPPHQKCSINGMKLWAGVGVVVFELGVYWFCQREVHYPPGVLINDEPGQVLLPDTTASIKHGAFVLKPLALYSI